MFLPILQSPSTSTVLVARYSRDPQQLAAAIRRTLHELDAGLPVDIQTRYQALDIILFGPRMATIALGIMGIMGAMLSITGIFGMAAYSVSKRLRELGIRIALGAQRPRARFHRVSGHPPRPAGIGRRCSCNVLAGATGNVDSSTTRGVG